MKVKDIRDMLGEGAFWVLVIAGFFILIQNYRGVNTVGACCDLCRIHMERASTNIVEVISDNVLTNNIDSVE
jgi:hypothetical protein